MTKYKCKHRKSWLIAGGYIEWCYQCGALRTMKESSENTVSPSSKWIIPTGKDGENPFYKLNLHLKIL